MKKKCTKCNIEKEVDEYYKEKRANDGYRSECKKCTSLRSYNRYHSNEIIRQQKLASAKEYHRAQRTEYQKKILSILKTSGCIDCGESNPIVLDFDHVKGIKLGGISRMALDHKPWHVIEQEIAKCEVRCANCHRIKTAKERNYYRDIDLDSL